MEWKTVRGTQDKKPEQLEYAGDYVFLRKNIHSVSETDPTDETKNFTGWEYDEILLTKEQYNDYVKIVGNPFYVSDTNDLKNRISNVETYIAASSES